MPRTVWYPGHMAKGKRQIEALAANVDLLLEARDARAPLLTSSPLLPLFSAKIKTAVVLSKADLACEKETERWRGALCAQGLAAWGADLRRGGVSGVIKYFANMKPAFRDLRVVVVGVPNVGKSMLINRLACRRAAAVGGVPGVTKGVSWFKGDGFLLADSPGILDPRKDARAHRLASWLGASRGEIIGSFEEHAKEAVKFLIKKGLFGGVESALGVKAQGTPDEILELIARRLGKLKRGGEADLEAAGRAFMDMTARGAFGRMTIEKVGEPPSWESLER